MNFSLVNFTKSAARFFRTESPLHLTHVESLNILSQCLRFNNFRHLKSKWDNLTYDKLATYGREYQNLLCYNTEEIKKSFKLTESQYGEFYGFHSESKYTVEFTFLNTHYCPLDTLLGLGNLDQGGYKNFYIFPRLGVINARKAPSFSVIAEGDGRFYASDNYYHCFGLSYVENLEERIVESLEYITDRDPKALFLIDNIDLPKELPQKLLEHPNFGYYRPRSGGSLSKGLVWNYKAGMEIPDWLV